MKNDDLDILFKDLQGEFDCDEPNDGHKSRFEDKLKALNNEGEENNSKMRSLWITLGSIAAVLLLFFSIGFFNNNNNNKLEDLADVSAEMAETQGFFTLAINQEIEKIETHRSEETKQLIADAMSQLQILENDYKSLQNDLNESGDDQRVIFAMITNFQNRVDLLKNVLEQINQINNLKTNIDENNNTI